MAGSIDGFSWFNAADFAQSFLYINTKRSDSRKANGMYELVADCLIKVLSRDYGVRLMGWRPKLA